MKYEILINILDRIRSEASVKYAVRYLPPDSELEKINHARSRAFIHLYLKVLFGLVDFDERENHITDGPYDGGIDGYFIDKDAKQVYLIQSKFRTNEKNFEQKEIALEEILNMDVSRILEGEQCDESGNQYSGKIKQLQRELSVLPEIARYSYRVVLLANLVDVSASKLRLLTGGYAAEVFDFEKDYEKLVFPVISGTYFTASDISIPIDLSNKNAGSKISYTVRTKIGDCEITVLFVPTIEIAKIMNKYKNSILKYNPRSYLDLEGKSVNDAIRHTILDTQTNEFALYNNGITMLSDETYINEKIGQKNKAQLSVKNPQIINGGQTSYTLSRIFSEHPEEDQDKIFQDKEVLLKIITLIDSNSHVNKIQLIDEISNATNKQTAVINADRFANEDFHLRIQRKVFNRYGLLYERKRGEFSDGVQNGYVADSKIIERNQFLRVFYAANGSIHKGAQKKLFQKNEFDDFDIDDDNAFDRFFLGLHVFRNLIKDMRQGQRIGRGVYAKVYAYVEMFFANGLVIDDATIDAGLQQLAVKWSEFMSEKRGNPRYRQLHIDKLTGEQKVKFKEEEYYERRTFEEDVLRFFTAA